MLPSTSSALSCSRTVRWPVSEGRILEFAVLVWLVDNTVAECTLHDPFSQPEKKPRVASGHVGEGCVSCKDFCNLRSLKLTKNLHHSYLNPVI